jgi:hypothetical protein
MFPMITWAVAEPSAGKMAAFAWEECPLAPITDMGALNGFYRNTQLQGHLVQDSLYLDSVPEFWTTGSDFPYRKKESDKEVFFVDEFSIATTIILQVEGEPEPITSQTSFWIPGEPAT